MWQRLFNDLRTQALKSTVVRLHSKSICLVGGYGREWIAFLDEGAGYQELVRGVIGFAQPYAGHGFVDQGF